MINGEPRVANTNNICKCNTYFRLTKITEHPAMLSTKLISRYATITVKATLPAGIYLFKVNNGNAGAMYEICSKSTIKTPERCHWHRTGTCIVNFEQILHIALMFSLLTLNSYYGWVLTLLKNISNCVTEKKFFF